MRPTSQCAGTSLSYSMSDGLMGRGVQALGDEWEMTAWCFSFSSPISRRFSPPAHKLFEIERRGVLEELVCFNES